MESVFGFLQRQVMRTPAEKPCSSQPGAGAGMDMCLCDPRPIDPAPLAVREVRRIVPDGLLIKWEQPISTCIKGYEVTLKNVKI